MSEDRIFVMNFMSKIKSLETVEKYFYHYRLGRSGSAITTQINVLVLDYKHELDLYKEKLKVVLENEYFTDEEKKFWEDLLAIECYFVTTRAILKRCKNYRKLLREYHKDTEIKKILKKLTFKNLKKTSDIRIVILLKLTKWRMWSLVRFAYKKF